MPVKLSDCRDCFFGVLPNPFASPWYTPDTHTHMQSCISMWAYECHATDVLVSTVEVLIITPKSNLQNTDFLCWQHTVWSLNAYKYVQLLLYWLRQKEAIKWFYLSSCKMHFFLSFYKIPLIFVYLLNPITFVLMITHNPLQRILVWI